MRFQNTGNDTAFSVRIIDTLSSLLDPTTFAPLSASHPYQVTISPNGLVEFFFDQILLPDSTTNEPASHGFVNFQVLPVSEVADFSVIENEVGIYFDFNRPIITNKVKSTLVTFLDEDKDGYNFWEDCNDRDIDVNPGIEEIPNNGIDDNCDGMNLTTNTTCGLPNPKANYLGGRKSMIEWDSVPNAISYRLQIRFKGMDRWIVTAMTRRIKVFIYAPINREYEYRIQSICTDGESEYTEVLEWANKEEGILLVAETRNIVNFKPDIVLEEAITSTLEAFPNPVNDKLQIAYPNQLDEAQLQIHHLSGKVVWSQSLLPTQNHHQIDMQSLPDGIYLVTIKEKGKRMQTLEIIKGSNR